MYEVALPNYNYWKLPFKAAVAATYLPRVAQGMYRYGKRLFYPYFFANRVYNAYQKAHPQEPKRHQFEPRNYRKNYLPYGNYNVNYRYNGKIRAKTSKRKTYKKRTQTRYRKKY